MSRTPGTFLSTCLQPTVYSLRSGLSLVELLIAIGILAVSMMLIAAAFPAGVAMSIAVSDETTSQSVFQEAVAVIRDNYSVSAPPTGTLTTTEYNVIPDADVGGLANRQFGTSGLFAWSALIKRIPGSAPMGNLCRVIVVVSRKPLGNPDYINEDYSTSGLPELRSVLCVDSTPTARTIEVDTTADASEPDPSTTPFDRVPSADYMIDGQTGIAYSIISRNDDDNTVTLLTTPPDPADVNHDFWVIPGEHDGSDYGRVSPAIRVFQTTLYLP